MPETPTTDTKVELAIQLGRTMHEFRNQVRQIIQVKIKENDINITVEMLEVMSVLWNRDGINQQEVADLTLRDKSSMTYLIDNLVKRNMVKRQEDESDRRNKLIYLTDKGFELKKQLHPLAVEVYAKATAELPLDNLQTGISTITRMIEGLQGY